MDRIRVLGDNEKQGFFLDGDGLDSFSNEDAQDEQDLWLIEHKKGQPFRVEIG